MMNPSLENALEWFTAAPVRWYESGKKDLSAGAEWVWEVLQGDFNEDPTTAQTVTGTVVSMIPFIDQICDIRDVVANCRKIDEDRSNKLAWLALVFTLIGLFPTLGSLVKGCLKIVFSSARRGVLGGMVKVVDSDLWKATLPVVEVGLQKMAQFLDSSPVRRTLKALKIDNPFKWLAEAVRKLGGSVTVGGLTKAFDQIIKALDGFVGFIKRCGTQALSTRAGHLLERVRDIRNAADHEIGQLVQPIQAWLDKLARRLEIDADMQYRAYTKTINPHVFLRPKLDAELEEFAKQKPDWVDATAKLKYEALKKPPTVPSGWFSLDSRVLPGEKHPLKDAYKTFHDAKPVTYPPGTELVRIVDPGSRDNSICWMTKAEFEKLRSKSEWRRRFAVWREWNGNGEYVTYTVPSGLGLKGWEGVTASQALKDDKGVVRFTLEGGTQQVVLNPEDLVKTSMGKRQATGWGYGDSTHHPSLTGVPVLTSYWHGN